MPKLSSFRTDLDLELSGRWVQFGDEDEKGKCIELKIARLGNKNYERQLGMLKRSDLKKIMRRRGRIDINALEPYMKESMAVHVLLDWKNIQDEKGKTIPYSPEKALELFNDHSLREFYEFVRDEAQDVEEYRAGVAEDSAGN